MSEVIKAEISVCRMIQQMRQSKVEAGPEGNGTVTLSIAVEGFEDIDGDRSLRLVSAHETDPLMIRTQVLNQDDELETVLAPVFPAPFALTREEKEEARAALRRAVRLER